MSYPATPYSLTSSYISSALTFFGAQNAAHQRLFHPSGIARCNPSDAKRAMCTGRGFAKWSRLRTAEAPQAAHDLAGTRPVVSDSSCCVAYEPYPH